MGGFFGITSTRECLGDVFFGTDYHSHLGTRRAGMAIFDKEANRFQRQIHNIENTPFRTKFENDLQKLNGTIGIGCISDTDPQPLLVRSHLGMFAIANVGIITNAEKIVADTFAAPGHYFMAMSSGKVNSCELVAALINRCGDLVEGIKFAQNLIEGSCTILLLTEDGIVAARDKLGLQLLRAHKVNVLVLMVGVEIRHGHVRRGHDLLTGGLKAEAGELVEIEIGGVGSVVREEKHTLACGTEIFDKTDGGNGSAMLKLLINMFKRSHGHKFLHRICIARVKGCANSTGAHRGVVDLPTWNHAQFNAARRKMEA